MASDLTDEERMARFVKSLDRWEKKKKNAPTIEITEPTEETTKAHEEVDAPPELEPEDNFWKYENKAPTPAPVGESEPKSEEGERESLRLEREFREKNGYNWWSPPPDKIKIPGYRPPNKPAPKVADPSDTDLTLESRCGEPAPRDIKFTPFAAICKFPYKFVPEIITEDLRQPLASAIFDSNKIYNRDWDLYYVYSNIDCPRPCLFVTEASFQALLDEINECFPDAHIKVPQRLKDKGLVIDFSGIEDSALRPRFLGHSSSRIQVDSWPDKLEVTESEYDIMSSKKDVELFKQKMDLAYEIGRAKKKATKQAKHTQTIVRRQGMAKELARAQKYLGLLPVEEENGLPDIASLNIGSVDPSKLAPNDFYKEPIFIAIDVEAYERNASQIIEVGVATLDTRDLKDVSPGVNGQGWQGAVRARHFRIAEHMDKVNKDFVDGCPEHFEFGTSEVIGLDKIASKLTSCFHAPFSSTHIVDEKIFGPKIDKQAPTVNQGKEKRNIIFLGHDVGQDIDYLRKLGFDPQNRGNLLETMDTRSMYQAYSHDNQPTSLGRTLAAFDFAGWHLHNAGNDAVYTVWALLAMSVASAAERGSTEASQRRAEHVAKKMDVAVKEAKERVREGSEGWDLVDGEEEGVKLDGGGEGADSGKEKGNAGVGSMTLETGEVKGGRGISGFVPWQGSETGLYTENGYPLNV